MLYPTVGLPRMGRTPFLYYEQCLCIRCLRRAGATPLLLPVSDSPSALNAALEQCDGFLFPGGPDIQPERYGQERLTVSDEPDLARDAFEFTLLSAALEARKPLFCIGRGMQLLNVAFGGTMLQTTRFQQEYQHYDPLHHTTATHPVDLDPEGLPAYLLDSDTAAVNSLHHQAVDDLGDGLWISADSPEGFAEALQIDDYPFCLAVQWHPELMALRTPAQQRLFQAFTDACRQIFS